jgi:hypothetical protein
MVLGIITWRRCLATLEHETFWWHFFFADICLLLLLLLILLPTTATFDTALWKPVLAERGKSLFERVGETYQVTHALTSTSASAWTTRRLHRPALGQPRTDTPRWFDVLVMNGAVVDAAGDLQATPLHWAARYASPPPASRAYYVIVADAIQDGVLIGPRLIKRSADQVCALTKATTPCTWRCITYSSPSTSSPLPSAWTSTLCTMGHSALMWSALPLTDPQIPILKNYWRRILRTWVYCDSSTRFSALTWAVVRVGILKLAQLLVQHGADLAVIDADAKCF